MASRKIDFEPQRESEERGKWERQWIVVWDVSLRHHKEKQIINIFLECDEHTDVE